MQDLNRYLNAQADPGSGGYSNALREIRHGHKLSHWMWYIFPQLKGLGYSEISAYYGVRDLEEAKAYGAHPVLGARLTEICRALLQVRHMTAVEIFGKTDALKLHSCMTLFAQACPQEPVFREVLHKYYDDVPDRATLRLLACG